MDGSLERLFLVFLSSYRKIVLNPTKFTTNKF